VKGFRSHHHSPFLSFSWRYEDDQDAAKSAIRLLSFRSTSLESGACLVGKETPVMDPHTVEITIKVYLKQMRSRLEKAASIARAAEACADSGDLEKGLEVALDVEQMIYEVNTFLNAASMINRLGKT
jgi:hypothetical protein